MNDYLFMQPHLIERIKSAVSGLAQVDSLFTLGDLSKQSKASPACWIIYCGDTPNDDKQSKNQVIQYWAAVLATKYPEQKQTGELLGQIIAALSDWSPKNESGVSPIIRAKEPQPVSFENDFLCFPLLFEARFIWPRKKTWQPQP